MTRFFSLIVVRVDRQFLVLTKGKFAPTGFIAGWPIVNLTTTGVKTGQLRTTPVVGIPDGQKIILIASNFGKPHHPAWYYNLKKNPIATIANKGATIVFKASEASITEQQKYWQTAVAIYPGFMLYADRAGRRIPIIILEPLEDT